MSKIALAMLIASGITPPSILPKRKERKVKKCLLCGVQHTHNNAFCSAMCCKEYDKGKRRYAEAVNA